jgi:hypothetical protein
VRDLGLDQPGRASIDDWFLTARVRGNLPRAPLDECSVAAPTVLDSDGRPLGMRLRRAY